MSQVTPMMQQYMQIKAAHPGMLLFFRLGDFYELFFEDAEVASKELEITLTGRPDLAGGRKIPMCGVPYHAAEGYLTRLVAAGHRVAICDQVEDPRAAKGIVKREVVRVVTPGTATLSGLLQEKKNSYLAALVREAGQIALAILEASTGYFAVTQLDDTELDPGLNALRSELLRLEPVEILLPPDSSSEALRSLLDQQHVSISEIESIDSEAARTSLENAGMLAEVANLSSPQLRAAALGYRYLQQTALVDLKHLKPLAVYTQEGSMLLDPSTRRSLELVQTMRENTFKGSLLSVLDTTRTVMGARLLRQWLLQPLLLRSLIEQRLDAVEELKNETLCRLELLAILDRVYDLERLMGRVALGTANARDLLALKQSLAVLPELKEQLENTHSAMLRQILRRLPDLDALVAILEQALVDDPPIVLREGGLMRDGYHEELDRYRTATRDGRQWIAALEQRERERTSIRSLKIGYNKVFGYYLEVTNPQLGLVPPDFIRKQTLANCERFVTPELKEIEETLLGASEKGNELEYQLFMQLKEKVSVETVAIQRTATQIATLDCLAGFAQLAEERRYVKPTLCDQPLLQIHEGRHPVVELSSEQPFIANDVRMDLEQNRVLIITGPNMAGKSTYLRMTALIVLMAQIGCFVPAAEARLGVFDRIFTRVGSGDDLAGGQSTFMVEMSELSAILANATSHSLLVLDEIGRGTSTYDGMSIARASLEYIQNPRRIGALTLFATHYHELTDMEGLLPGVRNYTVAVRERGEDVVFLHRITPGAADKSYGIAVARLAGLPKSLLERSKEILHTLENQRTAQQSISSSAAIVAAPNAKARDQLSLFGVAAKSEAEQRLEEADIMNMTPIAALNFLHELQKLMIRQR